MVRGTLRWPQERGLNLCEMLRYPTAIPRRCLRLRMRGEVREREERALSTNGAGRRYALSSTTVIGCVGRHLKRVSSRPSPQQWNGARRERTAGSSVCQRPVHSATNRSEASSPGARNDAMGVSCQRDESEFENLPSHGLGAAGGVFARLGWRRARSCTFEPTAAGATPSCGKRKGRGRSAGGKP